MMRFHVNCKPILLVTCVALLIVSQNASAALIAHYEFESGFTDSSGNGHTGTVTGGGVIVNDSERGNVYDNPSASFIDIDSTVAIPNLAANGGMTFAAWVNRDNFTASSSGSLTAVIGLGVSGDNPVMLMGVANNGSLGGYFEGDGGSDQVQLVGTAGEVTNEVWTHIAITYDRANNQAKSYVNGVLSNTFDITAVGDGVLDWGNAGVGSYESSTSNQKVFQGLIDDARIYDEVLTASEIRSLFNGSVGVPLDVEVGNPASD